MAEMQVTPGQLKAKAEELQQLNSRLQEKLTELISAETSLGTKWDGQAKETFHKAFETDGAKIQAFHDGIEVYIQAMQSIAAQYEAAESANIQTALNRTC